MNLKYRSIKFFSGYFKITVLFFTCFFFLALSQNSNAALRGVFKVRHCDTFLTNGHGFTAEAYSQSAEGAAVYEHFREIVGTHSSSLVEIVNIPRNANWTISDVLNFIAEDRERIEKGLTQLLSEFKLNDDHRLMVEYVLEQYAHSLHKERFAKQLEHYHREFGAIPARTVNARSYPQLMNFLYKNWAINRSFVSELQTAFEVKGVYALSAKVYELLPPQHLEEFVRAFEALGKSIILELEIDVATRDPRTGQQVWVEVKNVNNRIVSTGDSALKDYRKKKRALREFNDIISSSPRLKSLFPQSIEFVWFIRGAGVERTVRVEEAKRGLYLFDRTADGINSLIDQRNRRFQPPPKAAAPGQKRSYRDKVRSRAS